MRRIKHRFAICTNETDKAQVLSFADVKITAIVKAFWFTAKYGGAYVCDATKSPNGTVVFEALGAKHWAEVYGRDV